MKSKLFYQRLFAVVGASIGIIYGALTRFAFSRSGFQGFWGIMTIAFIFGVPFVLGFLTVYFIELQQKLSWPIRIFLPWGSTFAAMVVALAFVLEGLICIALWAPLSLLMSSLGGITAGVIGGWSRKSRNIVTVSFIALPYLVAPIEHQFELPREVRIVKTQIEIRANVATIWKNIKSVAPITPQEQNFSLTQLIGFPEPIAATLSYEGVGAVRHATFAGGVLFIETITQWEPEKRLVFSIKADAEHIPVATLDEHVTVGGPYFDVLEGEYEIERAGAASFVLHLSSKHRLSTHFNFYSSWWTDFIMRDIQMNILKIIKKRCEIEK